MQKLVKARIQFFVVACLYIEMESKTWKEGWVKAVLVSW